MFYYIFQLKGCTVLCIKQNKKYIYILLFRFIIYVLYSFTRTFSTFSLGLLFTRPVAWVNLLSRNQDKLASFDINTSHTQSAPNPYYACLLSMLCQCHIARGFNVFICTLTLTARSLPMGIT